MAPIGNVLIRCDASVRTGTGHSMRCLALAQAWQDAGGHAIFAMAESTKAVAQRIVAEKMELVLVSQAPGSPGDSDNVITLARQCSAQWVVVDGYIFGADYFAGLHRAGLTLLIVDDDGRADRYLADVVLNQNPQATVKVYPHCAASTRLLLGPENVLLRREFAKWKQWERTIRAPVRKVLVTMGGTDPDNVTLRVIEALLATSEFEAQVIVGGSNPHLAQLREAMGISTQRLRLVHNAGDISEWMAWADVAVAAAGTTAWEMAFMGLPAFLIVLAKNQEPIAKAVVDAGAALSLGSATWATNEGIKKWLRSLTASHEVLQRMSTSGRALVDGRGAERVVTAMLERDRVMRPERPVVSADARERTDVRERRSDGR
jgi:UDP-2,4-diacetamido-2,4,6-trideoxy-beta-L-altropyranose hydrolase